MVGDVLYHCIIINVWGCVSSGSSVSSGDGGGSSSDDDGGGSGGDSRGGGSVSGSSDGNDAKKQRIMNL